MSDAEQIGENIAEDVSSAIVAAQNETANAAETAKFIAEAALEGERGGRIRNLEEEMDECQETQAGLSEGMAALTLGLTTLQAEMRLLTQMLSPAPTPPPAENADLTPPEPEVTPPQAPDPEPAPANPSPPAKKKRRWI